MKYTFIKGEDIKLIDIENVSKETLDQLAKDGWSQAKEDVPKEEKPVKKTAKKIAKKKAKVNDDS